MPAEPNHDIVVEQAARIDELLKEVDRLKAYGERVYPQMRAAQAEARMAKRALENHQMCVVDVGVGNIREKENNEAKIKRLEQEKRAEIAGAAKLKADIALLNAEIVMHKNRMPFVKKHTLEEVFRHLLKELPNVATLYDRRGQSLTNNSRTEIYNSNSPPPWTYDDLNPIRQGLYKRDKHILTQASEVCNIQVNHWKEQFKQSEIQKHNINAHLSKTQQELQQARQIISALQPAQPAAKRPRLENEAPAHGGHGVQPSNVVQPGHGVQPGNEVQPGNGANRGGNVPLEGIGLGYSQFFSGSTVGPQNKSPAPVVPNLAPATPQGRKRKMDE